MTTPTLLIDKSRILNNYRDIKEALPEFHIAYAMKSNPHNSILELLNDERASFEVASINEIATLCELDIPLNKVLFSNPVKPIESIAQAVELGVQNFTFDSLTELSKFIPYKKQIQLMLRIDVSNQGSLWALNNKFGCPALLLPEIFKYMQKHEIPLSGISFHVGSQCEAEKTWDVAMNEALEAILLAQSFDLHPDSLNIGGGFPIYMGREIPSVKAIADRIHRKIGEWKTEQGIEIMNFYAEPGRFISGSAGTLITKIIGIADRMNEGQMEKWVYLDTGVFSGLMETIDGITYPIISSGSGNLEEVMLCGPSCDSMDKMYSTLLASPKVGDTLHLSGAGAYTTVYQTQFNGIDAPEIVFMDSSNDYPNEYPDDAINKNSEL